jgi:hypothetical protein
MRAESDTSMADDPYFIASKYQTFFHRRSE